MDPRREGFVEGREKREGREDRMRARYLERKGSEKRMCEEVGGRWKEREYENMVDR